MPLPTQLKELVLSAPSKYLQRSIGRMPPHCASSEDMEAISHPPMRKVVCMALASSRSTSRGSYRKQVSVRQLIHPGKSRVASPVTRRRPPLGRGPGSRLCIASKRWIGASGERGYSDRLGAERRANSTVCQKATHISRMGLLGGRFVFVGITWKNVRHLINTVPEIRGGQTMLRQAA